MTIFRKMTTFHNMTIFHKMTSFLNKIYKWPKIFDQFFNTTTFFTTKKLTDQHGRYNISFYAMRRTIHYKVNTDSVLSKYNLCFL